MKAHKKIICLTIVIAVLLSSLALSVFNAYAQTQKLVLDVRASGTIDGENDLAWFTYTPDESGIYSFLSYNVYASEGYLFIREQNSDGSRTYKQLSYARNDPDYEINEHNFRQFCLTYHLEKGVTYYFAAGFYLSEERVSGNMAVMLRCDKYDTSIESVTASCNAELEAYQDGSMMIDSNGAYYFMYDISKIITNTTVTIYYLDGTSSSVTGEELIDGYIISYRHNQNYVHWYPQESDEYTANTFTVKVLDKSFSFDISIVYSARYNVYGKITDTLGNPLANASVITSTHETIATTNSNGEFSFSSTAGFSSYTIKAENAIDRNMQILVTANNSKNNYTSTPIELCAYDYCPDGIINAKDFAIIKRTVSSQELEGIKNDFQSHINFTQENYGASELM